MKAADSYASSWLAGDTKSALNDIAIALAPFDATQDGAVDKLSAIKERLRGPHALVKHFAGLPFGKRLVCFIDKLLLDIKKTAMVVCTIFNRTNPSLRPGGCYTL
jgi:hypothetical protein